MTCQPEISPQPAYRASWFYLLILLFILLIAYWPISFHVFSLKNDALNYFLPVRTLITESYANYQLPLWTPYINFGYPVHSDMQAGVWNPFVQLLSLAGPYKLYTLQLETLLYIYISGMGMFFLLRHFNVHPYANLLASCGFMLSGFNSDSCQFLYWIAGNSFLPFVFLFYYRLLHERLIRHAAGTALALFLFLVCGSPADFIINAYLMLAMLGAFIFSALKNKSPGLNWKKLIGLHLLVIVLFLLLSAPALLSFLQGRSVMARGTGISAADALTNSLYPPLVSSYLAPLPIWKMPGAEVTDPLTRNSYMGIAAFLLTLLAFLTKSRSPLVSFSKWASIVFLVFSFGQYGGLRMLTYDLLPLMDTFRHPANAKMFTLFFGAILSAHAFHNLIIGTTAQRPLKIAFLLILLIAAILLGWAFTIPVDLFSRFRITDLPATMSGLKTAMSSLSFADLVIINLLIQLPFIILSWYWLVKKSAPGKFVIMAMINCILFTILFQPVTVVRNEKAAVVEKMIKVHTVKGYPLPNLSIPISQNNQLSREEYLHMGPVNLYNKKIGRSDFFVCPSNLILHKKFWGNKRLRDSILGKPFLNTSVMHPGESSRLTTFHPNLINGQIKIFSAKQFSLMQTYHPNWILRIDGRPASKVITHGAFLGFDMPAGDHYFSLEYDAGLVPIAFIVSMVSLLLVLIICGIHFIPPPQKPVSD